MFSRRDFLARLGGLAGVLAVPGCPSRGTGGRLPADAVRSSATYAYVGCYSTPDRDGNGEGINVYRVDPDSGDWAHVQLVDGLENPSFLALDRDQRFLYSVHGDRRHASAFAVHPGNGRLTRLNRQDVGGENATHLSVDPTSRFLVVSHYASGSMAVLPINSDGSLAPPSDLIKSRAPQGRTPSGKPARTLITIRSTLPEGSFWYQNLGFDAVFVFRLDSDSGRWCPQPALS